MRILLSAYSCEPGRGSEPGFGWNWAVHLARAGHDVQVLTRPRHSEKIERHLHQSPVGGLDVKYVGLPDAAKHVLRGQSGVYLRYLLWQRVLVSVARRLHERRPFDLVHHVTWGSLIGGSGLWRLGVPFVFGPVGGGQVAPSGFRDVLRDGWRTETVRTCLVRHVVPWLWPVRRILRNTDLILATNRETKELAEKMGARRVELALDTGLPSGFFSSPANRRPRADDPLRVLWVGRFLPRKAIRLSLEAVHRMRAPVRLTILGDGPQRTHLEDWLEELDIEHSVDWRGHVPWTHVKEAYRSHDVFLFTSLRDSFGSQLLEAMANGLPVVTLDLHGARDFVPDDAGVKVPVHDLHRTAEHLGRALDMLADQTDRRWEMGEAAFRFVSRFQWEERARRMTVRYQRLVGPRSHDSDTAVSGRPLSIDESRA